MRLNLRYFLCFLLGMGFLTPGTQAQNFESTWQEFLGNPLSASISELDKPDKKEQAILYLKFCLMYGTKHFCADEIAPSEEMIAEIKSMDPTVMEKIPGFKERFDDLVAKMAVHYKVDTHFKKFLKSRDVGFPSAISELDLAKSVCEKGTLAMYFQMESYAHYCKGDIPKSKDNFENKVAKLTAISSFKMSANPGLEGEVKTMKDLFAGLAKLDPAWKTYVDTDKSPGFETELPLIPCYTIPNMKVYMLRAAVDPCKNGSEMLAKIKALQETNSHPIPSDLAEKIAWLEAKVGGGAEAVAVLDKAWKEFVPTDKLKGPIEFVYDYPCNKDAQVKAYIMDGTINTCEKGEEMLANIAKVRKESNPSLDETTLGKLKNLEAKVKKQKDDLALLDKAWKEFVPTDTLTTPIQFGYDYCDKAGVIKAYVMNGTVNFCAQGEKMLAAISKTQSEFHPELDDVTLEKIANLQARAKRSAEELATLNEVWKEFIANGDTMLRPFTLVPFYCDKIAQIKSWTILGTMDPCPPPATKLLAKIDAMVKNDKLTLDAELACRVLRLRGKIYQCRYWELVLQAWKETNEERERFGPASSAIMAKDLYSSTLQAACQANVKYYPLGNIGIKYIIIVYLCEKVDLAKMGDPEYYKKIASWVDSEVLQRYCEANLRCKEDFFIYLEGHTDGNSFSGANYAESLALPAGTPYTHFIGKDTLQKKTTAEITKSLKSNMELGLARAWTVKKQLDFMNVPITIGAFEHPASEKGGEFRRIEIELNITNLLLDFYEKRLNELLIKSGIGERPKKC